MSNANNGFNAINATIPHNLQTANSVSNGILKQPGVIETGQHKVIQEVHTSERLGKQQGVDVASKSREVHHLCCDSSNHIPIHIVYSGMDPPRRKKLFQFEEMWLSNPGCKEIVQAVEEEAVLSGDNSSVRQLKKEIEDWRDKEATMWAQRSRLLWARQWDKNSKYFHSCATKRYRKNLIEGLRAGDGSWKNKPEEIAKVLVNYYQSLFTFMGQMDSSRVLECVLQVITYEMNALLSQKFEVNEVEMALQQMALLKAPGLDGMPPLFYQHFRSTIHHDVTSSILLWLNSDDSLLFCKATREECDKVLDILNGYEEASGQKGGMSSKEGLVGGLVTGKKIRIWQDHWLPKLHPPHLLYCPLADFENATVDILIEPSSRQWLPEMIDGLFNVEEAILVKNIPLSREPSEDILFWPHSSDGRYSCKTSYKFLKMEAGLNAETQAPTSDEKHVWREIWSMCVPPKVKTLSWRACREAMPTMSSLLRRTITEDPLCVRCRASTENSLHALWSCPELDSVWAEMELWSFRGSVQFFDFKELLSWLIKNKLQLEFFAITVWSIWNQRNRVRLNQPTNALRKIAHLYKVWLTEFKARQELGSNDIEAIAAGWALSFALEVGVKRAVLEGESLVVMKGLMEAERPLAPLGLLLKEAKNLSQKFDELLYSRTKREGNTLAHSLARHATGIPDFLV
ncbi:hypothetical protein SO802_028832 [Lithocarpus litseifolius]|uniref:Reverse transcriptase zinc-binding domain-containing protein n=1 Tax=Lithocarpus litseifolius TaxID=425828 RepID=A0AAW2BTA6_9ROSI